MFIRAWARISGRCCEHVVSVCFFLFCVLPKKLKRKQMLIFFCSEGLLLCVRYTEVPYLFIYFFIHCLLSCLILWVVYTHTHTRNSLWVLKQQLVKVKAEGDDNKPDFFSFFFSLCDWATAEDSRSCPPRRQAHCVDQRGARWLDEGWKPPQLANRDGVVRHCVGFPVTSFCSRSFQRHPSPPPVPLSSSTSPLFTSRLSTLPHVYDFSPSF